ncbi:DUF1800 domain-containing protein [Spirosoma sp. KCTC 42546]|uniref:DUF1800 domain-containing protein n=1 Tax=Spirosoma sp. KCTC 42546 TaxID=2520506 RepID=UPI00115C3C56|nr:DUF1800 domain-containing protein [Spirosoma sp. KCTC 42546]QDK79351.1 DUF1800 domain-containing protein [Spirosoma sp. KCTC 42546]
MVSLDPYTTLLTTKTAAHLLRRATFGPTQAEIANFTGLTAAQAVQQLITNANYSPAPPVDLDHDQPTAGQTYLNKPFNHARNFDFGHYLRCWWLGLMTSQAAPPSLLDKLTLFWQNHFVTTRETVGDYRFLNQYLLLLRNNSLGSFRTLVTQITKEPAMLRYLNGNENVVGHPNENYARELQELFTVGAFDFTGNKNYTEDDVKAAAQVLTGWEYTNHELDGSTSFATTFTDAKHDSTDKTFSAHYNNTVITGRATSLPGTTSAGDAELDDLVTMLLSHPHTSRFICRKLYRWYVNPNVTQTIEDTIIGPLAQVFQEGNFAIQPVIVKLLTSQVFFDETTIGAIVKSPAELAIGAMRFFNQPVPDITTEYAAFKTYFDFVYYRMQDMQLAVLDQSSVFGYEAYYQTGYSKIWINSTTIGFRYDYTDAYVLRYLQVKPDYLMGIDVLTKATALQPNFSDVAGTPAISSVDILNGFTTNLFVYDLLPSQRDFLIDTILMQNLPRTSWIFQWNAYRTDPTDGGARYEVRSRLENLMKYMLRMAEYHIF